MAAKRLSPGVYEVNGKRIQAASAAEAEKKAGAAGKKADDKKDTGAGKNTATTPQGEQIKLDKSEKKVLDDVKGGQGITNVLGFDKPLSRISTETPEDQKAFIESLRQLADPSSAAFVGKRSDEEKGAISSLKDLMGKAGEQTPEEAKALSSLEGIMNSAGIRSDEMKGVLSSLKDRVATAGQRSSEMQSTLDLMKQGLAGLNAPENQALREQAQKEVDRKYKAAVEDFQNQSRLSGMGSASRAGMRNARRDALGAQADMEQKNLLANIDIQDSRRKDYANTLSEQETNEDQRYRNAIDAYRDQLSGTEKTEFDQRQGATRDYASGVNDYTANKFNRMNTATNNYANTVGQYGTNERARVNEALQNYGGSLTDRNNYFLDTSKVNLGQERTDRAAAVQSALGFAGLSETERARRRALRDSKRRGGDGRTNPNGAGNTATQQPGYSAQDYINEVQSIYNNGG